MDKLQATCLRRLRTTSARTACIEIESLVLEGNLRTCGLRFAAPLINLLRQGDERSCMRIARPSGRDREARVPANADIRIESQFRQDWESHLVRCPPAAALTKYINALTRYRSD